MDKLDQQIEAARQRSELECSTGAFAVSAEYDAEHKALIVGLANGVWVSFPVESLQVLSQVSPEQVSEVEITPSGLGLHWESLDWDLSLPHLLEGFFGSKSWMKELARRGGSARSDRKALTSRENGKKGGRPPKADQESVASASPLA